MEQMRQLALALPVRKTFVREDFLVALCNEEAVAWVDKYPQWPVHSVMILGPKGCGKTHLAHVFASEVIEAADLDENFMPCGDRIVVENVDGEVNERALFHLFNRTKERGIGVLMTARRQPDFYLADWASRAALMPKVFISPPDDALMYAVMAAGFAARGALVEPAVLEYALKRVERSFGAVQRLVEEADALALADARAITIPMLRLVLEGC